MEGAKKRYKIMTPEKSGGFRFWAGNCSEYRVILGTSLIVQGISSPEAIKKKMGVCVAGQAVDRRQDQLSLLAQESTNIDRNRLQAFNYWEILESWSELTSRYVDIDFDEWRAAVVIDYVISKK